jgi:hypothetical protein
MDALPAPPTPESTCNWNLILDLLGRLYTPQEARETAEGIAALIAAMPPEAARPREPWSEKDALCITYADSILGAGTPLETLHRFFTARVGQKINTIHLLPFYPYTSDDGFSVVDYDTVRPDLGSWDHIFAMSLNHRLVFDCVVNHVSAASHYMQRYAEGHPEATGFFIEMDPGTDLSMVTRPRTLPLLHEFETRTGRKWLWTTFSQDQVDLNFQNPRVLLEIVRVMLDYTARGACMLRLDAIPYVWKKPGTTCIHLEETHVLVKLFRAIYECAAPHVRLLSETNVPHEENLAYFGDALDEAHMIYNFTLAPLILWTIARGDARLLASWAARLKPVAEHATYLNITATHDGIGLRPTEGLLSDAQRRELCDRVVRHGGLVSHKRNPDGSDSPYELNISFFDALTDPASTEPLSLQVDRFLVSQAIPMAMLGVPGIYIHSLVGSRNDIEGVKRSGIPRRINRAQLKIDDLEQELDDPASRRGRVMRGMLHLLDVRTAHTAFSPAAEQVIHDLSPALFTVERHNTRTGERVLCLHNITDKGFSLEWPLADAQPVEDLLTPYDDIQAQPTLRFAPYQVRWVRLG